MGWPGPMTHRQYRLWHAWMEAEWNEPDRHDHYVMALAAHVLQVPALVWGKDPGKLDVNDFKLKFTVEAAKQKVVLTDAERAAMEEQMWLAGMGMSPAMIAKAKADGGRKRD